MAWAKPEHTPAEVDAAGRLLVSGDGIADVFSEAAALDVLNNWRSCHSFPLNTFQTGLRQRARKVYPSALVAQRLKRIPSMLFKLERFPTMKLSKVQDIGGCRAVVDTVAQVRRLRSFYRKGSKLRHEFVREKDYIEKPKESGYRSLHLVYRYRSDRSQVYDGLLIEIQLRTRLQHAWATAVETVGTFLDQSLKSSQGSAEWLRFFELVSSAFALLEKTPTVPETPSNRSELKGLIKKMAGELNVKTALGGYGAALDITEHAPEHADADYFLLSLNPTENTLSVQGYRRNELPKATEDYLAAEKRLRNVAAAQAVLVAADSLKALRRAYPNYYLDTDMFLVFLAGVTR